MNSNIAEPLIKMLGNFEELVPFFVADVDQGGIDPDSIAGVTQFGAVGHGGLVYREHILHVRRAAFIIQHLLFKSFIR